MALRTTFVAHSLCGHSVLFWSSFDSTTHKGWDVAEVAPAIGDLGVSTNIGDSFNLWRTGWSTFVQISLASVKPSQLSVRCEVQPNGSAPNSRASLHQVRICESWLGSHGFPVQSGSLESSNPLCVVCDGGEPMFLQRDRVLEFVSETVLSIACSGPNRKVCVAIRVRGLMNELDAMVASSSRDLCHWFKRQRRRTFFRLWMVAWRGRLLRSLAAHWHLRHETEEICWCSSPQWLKSLWSRIGVFVHKTVQMLLVQVARVTRRVLIS